MWYDLIFKPTVDARRLVEEYYNSSTIWCAPKEHKTVTKLRLYDFDREFAQDPNAQVVPCGQEIDGDVAADGSTETIKRMLFQESDNNLNFISSCKCGKYRGNFARGMLCPVCKTECKDDFANEIRYRAWLEIPDFMPPMLHPAAYRILGRWMGSVKRKKRILDFILDVDSELPEPYASILGQGPGYFYNNFDNIIRYFMEHGSANQRYNMFIQKFIDTYRNVLFIRHVPVLNQALHILTKSGTLTYNDDASTCILETCIELGNAIYQYRHNPSANKSYLEQCSYAVYRAYLNYVEKINKTKLCGKYGYIRKSLLASRLNSTFRAVIVPITTVHRADTVEVPWKIGVAGHKLEIIGALQRDFKMTVGKATEKYFRSLVQFDQDVANILDRLVVESPYIGLPLLLGRNPTLRHGAIQLLFASVIKKDINDDTIGLSPTVISAPNADFDGDAVYCMFLKECAEVIKFMAIHPMTTMMSGVGDGLTNEVRLTNEHTLAANRWLMLDDAAEAW